MGRGPCAFKESDLTRAVKAARKAGLEVERVEVDRDGKIVIITGKPGASGELNGNGSAENPWDEVLKNAPDKERTA